MYSIGIEIIQGVSGTLGVILTVPLVSWITSRALTAGGTQTALPERKEEIRTVKGLRGAQSFCINKRSGGACAFQEII